MALLPYSDLCYHDPRNPHYTELGLEDERESPRPKGCACDNCFYGRDRLAVEVIRLHTELEHIANANYRKWDPEMRNPEEFVRWAQNRAPQEVSMSRRCPVLDDIESTTGYHFMHFDCPYCGSAHEAEGDVRGETFNCQDCREPFVVR